MRKQIAGVFIERDGKILLHKRAFEPKGKWDCIGGYVEEGETIEDAAKREAKEETGLTVELGRVLGSFDYYSGEEKTITMFMAKIVGGEVQKSREGEPFWIRPADIKKEMLAFPQYQLRALEQCRAYLDKQKR